MSALVKKLELSALVGLTDAQRQRVLLLDQLCREIHALRATGLSAQKAAERVAKGRDVARGFSANRLRCRYYDWLKLGTFALINKSEQKRSKAELSIADIFKGYCERNQRSCAQAYKRMMVDFRTGVYFPDIGTWRDVFMSEFPTKPIPNECPNDWVPRGWTERNAMRFAPTKMELKAARVGRAAAREFLPPVLSTRVGLKPFQYVMVDDMWHNALVNYPGNKGAQRVLEVAMLDVASGCRFLYGCKVRREDEEKGVIRGLVMNDTLSLIAHQLCYIGYHPDGIVFGLERGTATLDRATEFVLGQLSGGEGYIDKGEIVWSVEPRIRIKRGGMLADKLHNGLFKRQPRGNYKTKAALESQHSLMQNAIADLSAQVGNGRDNAPEQNYGLEKHNAHLLKLAENLPEERAALLEMPVLNYAEYLGLVTEAYDRVNKRTDHDLEGWEECGYTEIYFRFSSFSNDWFPMSRLADLPAQERMMMSEMIRQMPETYCKNEPLSPAAVCEAGSKDLVKLGEWAMPLILGVKRAIKARVQENGLIEFRNKDYGTSVFRFLARTMMTPDGFVEPLKAGSEYLVHVNPFKEDVAFISDLDGKLLGKVARWNAVQDLDYEALNRKAGVVAKMEREALSQTRRRAAPQIQSSINRSINNLKVINGEPITDEELGEFARIRATKGGLSDVFGEVGIRQEAEGISADWDLRKGDSPVGADESGLRDIY